jgi:uncharacterized membrane protein HdeD (DUF308 family)
MKDHYPSGLYLLFGVIILIGGTVMTLSGVSHFRGVYREGWQALLMGAFGIIYGAVCIYNGLRKR